MSPGVTCELLSASVCSVAVSVAAPGPKLWTAESIGAAAPNVTRSDTTSGARFSVRSAQNVSWSDESSRPPATRTRSAPRV